jgi:hypothetical protein
VFSAFCASKSHDQYARFYSVSVENASHIHHYNACHHERHGHGHGHAHAHHHPHHGIHGGSGIGVHGGNGSGRSNGVKESLSLLDVALLNVEKLSSELERVEQSHLVLGDENQSLHRQEMELSSVVAQLEQSFDDNNLTQLKVKAVRAAALAAVQKLGEFVWTHADRFVDDVATHVSAAALKHIKQQCVTPLLDNVETGLLQCRAEIKAI